MPLVILDDADADAIRQAIHPVLTDGMLPTSRVMADDIAGQAERDVMAADPNWQTTLTGPNAGQLRSAAILQAAYYLAPTALPLIPSSMTLGDFRVNMDVPKLSDILNGLATRFRSALAYTQVEQKAIRPIFAFGRASGSAGQMARGNQPPWVI